MIPECNECGRTRPIHKRGMCFGCWVGVGSGGIRVNWVGGEGYGRKAFHDMTYREATAMHTSGDPSRPLEPRHTKSNVWAPVK